MDQKKNILFLSPWYPDKKDPMPGLFVQRHALAATIYNNVKVLYVKGYPDQVQKEKVFTKTPLDELRIYFKNGKGLLGRINYYYEFVRVHFEGLNELAEKWGRRPDLVHVNILTREGVVALIWKKLYGIPYVVTEHWSRYQTGTYKGLLRKYFTKKVVKNASAILPVTQHLEQSMISCGLDHPNYQVMPNVVDVTRFQPAEKAPAHKKQILHISCFSDEPKNITGIINTTYALAQQRKDFKLVLVGEGEDFESLKKYAFSKKGGKNVFEFRGLLEGVDLINEIQRSDFHLMFSRYENLPVVNLECFACGIPVLSSDVGGIKEHLTKELGRLVPSEDNAALLEAMDDMLNHVQDYDKVFIRDYAVKHFSQEAIGKLLDEIYQKAIQA